MRSLKKLLSWAENNKQTTTMMNALPVATAWEHFADQIRYEIDDMSQDEGEDQVLQHFSARRGTEVRNAVATMCKPVSEVLWND